MKKILASLVAVLLIAYSGIAIADLSVKDGAGATKTIFNFVCFTTKLCNATVLVDSTGTEIAPATHADATAAVPCLNATAWNTNSYTTGGTNPVNCDLKGAFWMDWGAVNGVALLAGNGATGTGSPRVTIASDNTPFQVKQTDGTTVVVTDPCQGSAKLYKPVSITTNTTTNVIIGASAKKTYICHIFLTSAAADNVAIIEGTTGGTCGSGTLGLIGGTTAANGPNFAANGGMSLGTGGFSIAATTTNQNDVCLITSASTPLAGVISYAQQ